MLRVVPVWLCAIVALVALTGGAVFRPAPVLASSGTLSMETALHDSPDPAAPVIAVLAAGTIVSIDGPPVEGFYPVTAGDSSGWMRGETIQLEKDTPYPDVTQGTEVDPLVDDTVESVPAEAPAEREPATDASPVTTVDPATDPVADTAATLDGSVPADELAPVNESVPVDPPARTMRPQWPPSQRRTRHRWDRRAWPLMPRFGPDLAPISLSSSPLQWAAPSSRRAT
jgi:hypothetical protein